MGPPPMLTRVVSSTPVSFPAFDATNAVARDSFFNYNGYFNKIRNHTLLQMNDIDMKCDTTGKK
jgi:hypothetical protein